MSTNSSASSSTSPSPRRRPNVKLPITSIPDMRFEQSYLASIRGFVHEVEGVAAEEMKEKRIEDDERRHTGISKEGGTLDAKDKHSAPKVMTARSPRGEPELWLGRLRIEWWPLLYLTMRDQILSPVVQGVVFGVGGLALSQLRLFLKAAR